MGGGICGGLGGVVEGNSGGEELGRGGGDEGKGGGGGLFLPSMESGEAALALSGESSLGVSDTFDILTGLGFVRGGGCFRGDFSVSMTMRAVEVSAGFETVSVVVGVIRGELCSVETVSADNSLGSVGGGVPILAARFCLILFRRSLNEPIAILLASTPLPGRLPLPEPRLYVESALVEPRLDVS